MSLEAIFVDIALAGVASVQHNHLDWWPICLQGKSLANLLKDLDPKQKKSVVLCYIGKKKKIYQNIFV